jgi:hypothetical protein
MELRPPCLPRPAIGPVLPLALLVVVYAACASSEPQTNLTGGGGTGGAAAGTSGGAGTGGSVGQAGSGGTTGAGAGIAGVGGVGGAAGMANGAGGAAGASTAGIGGRGGAAGRGGSNDGSAGTGGAVAGGGRGGNMAGGSGGTGAPGGATAGAGGTGGGAGLGGQSLCGPGKFLICESFESTTIGGVPSGWSKHGDATVQADQAARGAHALKIGAAASGERRIYADASMLGSGHWGRIFYRVQVPAALPGAGNVIHSTLVAFQGNGPQNGSSEYRVVDTVEDSNGKHQFLWNVQPSSVAEFGKGSPYNWSYDGNWHCAEWHVDGATQSYQFFIDGAEVSQIAINNGAGKYSGTDIPNVFTQARVGWNNYQSASPGFVVWIDEIAIHTSRIGCGN